MAETEITIPMKFDETNFFILSPNPIEPANIVGAMNLSSRCREIPSNMTHSKANRGGSGLINGAGKR